LKLKVSVSNFTTDRVSGRANKLFSKKSQNFVQFHYYIFLDENWWLKIYSENYYVNNTMLWDWMLDSNQIFLDWCQQNG